MDKTNVLAVIKSGLISAVLGFSISFAINYFLVSAADSQISYAFNNGMSGLFSGFFGGFFGLIAYLKASR